MKKKAQTYYIKLKDIYEECPDEIIIVRTKRNVNDVINIIEHAIDAWDNERTRLSTSKIEYVYEVLNRKHFNWASLGFDAVLDF